VTKPSTRDAFEGEFECEDADDDEDDDDEKKKKKRKKRKVIEQIKTIEVDEQTRRGRHNKVTRVEEEEG
jgi:hypothetical protein